MSFFAEFIFVTPAKKASIASGNGEWDLKIFN